MKLQEIEAIVNKILSIPVEKWNSSHDFVIDDIYYYLSGLTNWERDDCDFFLCITDKAYVTRNDIVIRVKSTEEQYRKLLEKQEEVEDYLKNKYLNILLNYESTNSK